MFSDSAYVDCFSKINAKVIAVAHQVSELPVMPPGIGSAGLCNWASRADACPGEHVPVWWDALRGFLACEVPALSWWELFVVSRCASLTPVLSVWPVVWGVRISNALRYHWTILYQRTLSFCEYSCVNILKVTVHIFRPCIIIYKVLCWILHDFPHSWNKESARSSFQIRAVFIEEGDSFIGLVIK